MMKYRNIGKLVAAFGVKGEMIFEHTLGKKSSLKGLAAIFIEDRKDAMLPYFIESTRIKSATEVIIKLDGINAREQATKLLQKPVWLEEQEALKYAAKTAPFSLLGFHVIDAGIDLGEILELIEQPHQLLGRIVWQEKEILIPLHDETIEKVDRLHKKLFVRLPEGLLDIYLK